MLVFGSAKKRCIKNLKKKNPNPEQIQYYSAYQNRKKKEETKINKYIEKKKKQ